MNLTRKGRPGDNVTLIGKERRLDVLSIGSRWKLYNIEANIDLTVINAYFWPKTYHTFKICQQLYNEIIQTILDIWAYQCNYAIPY